MNEDGMWTALRPALDAMGLDPVRVENVLGEGTPDVNYVGGWIELKHLDAWPKRSDTVVHFERFTVFQKEFLRRRWWAGEATWLMVRVGPELLLFSGFDAPAVRQGLSQTGLRLLSVWGSRDGRWSDLGPVLRRRTEDLSPPLRARLLRQMALFRLDQVAAHLGVRPEDVADAELREDNPLTNDLIDNLVC